MFYFAGLAFKNHGILPQDYLQMSMEERAFIAGVDLLTAETKQKEREKR